MLTVHQNLLAQLVGVIALLISVSIFQVNNRKKMLHIGVIGALFWTAHFFLLGAATGAALNAVGAVRDFTLARTKPKAKNLWILGIIMILAALATALTWQGWISLLPITACGLSGLSFWSNNTTQIRKLYLLVPPLWFSYNFVAHSYPGMAIESLLIISNLVAQLRFDSSKRFHVLLKKSFAIVRI